MKEIICSYDNLLKAFKKCKQDIMWKDSVIGYNKNKLTNLQNLKDELLSGSYKISDYIKFTIYEPKKREIVSTRLKDRVFQRSMCDNYLYNELTRHFIYDNSACQIGKGTDFARNRLSVHLQKFHREHGLNGYVLKCDIKDYFGSTDHEIAKQMITKKVREKWVSDKVCEIIDSFEGDKGIGLGSQVSQLIQLAVLDDLDHIIKERYRIKHYVRYMDDFILINQDKLYLKEVKDFISSYLISIKLSLNEKKTHIFKLTQPIKFLGFSYRLTDTGKVVKKILRENLKHERRKIKGLIGRVESGYMEMHQVQTCYDDWKAHACKGNTHNLILKMDKLFKERKQEIWKKSVEPRQLRMTQSKKQETMNLAVRKLGSEKKSEGCF